MFFFSGDQSASNSAEQTQVDNRIQQIIDMEDLDVLPDLRALNSSQHKSKFDRFWEECQKFLSEDLGTGVDDRRHGNITHLARAISIEDLVQQVRARCPADTSTPSVEWVRVQVWPKTPSSRYWKIQAEIYGSATPMEALSCQCTLCSSLLQVCIYMYMYVCT